MQDAVSASKTEASNRQQVKEAIYWARFEGAQIRIDGATVYNGADFPTNSNSADSSLAEIWRAWGARFLELIDRLIHPGSTIAILAFNGAQFAPVKSLPLL